MIKLYSLKPQNKEGGSSQSGMGGKKATAAQLRVTKGMIVYYVHSDLMVRIT